MNGPDILKELTIVLKESGWLDKATEYMREHPERYTSCQSYDGLIASVALSVSYQPASLKDIQNVKPALFTDVGSMASVSNSYIEYSTGSIRQCTYINNEKVTEVYNAGSRDTGTQ